MKKDKNKYLKKYTKNQSKENLINLKKANAKFKLNLVRKKKLSWEKYIIEMNDDIEAKELWKRLRLINRKSNIKTILNMKDDQGMVIENPQDISDIIGRFYQGISSFDTMSQQQQIKINQLKMNSLLHQ